MRSVIERPNRPQVKTHPQTEQDGMTDMIMASPYASIARLIPHTHGVPRTCCTRGPYTGTCSVQMPGNAQNGSVRCPLRSRLLSSRFRLKTYLYNSVELRALWSSCPARPLTVGFRAATVVSRSCASAEQHRRKAKGCDKRFNNRHALRAIFCTLVTSPGILPCNR